MEGPPSLHPSDGPVTGPAAQTIAPEAPPPDFAIVPEASGNPTWTKWTTERVMVGGRPRSVFQEVALTEQEFAHLEQMVALFLRTITITEGAYESYVHPRKGKRRRPRPVERRALLEDVQGVNLRLASPTGAPFRAADVFVSVGMSDGHRYHLNPATGKPLRMCVFCSKSYVSVQVAPDGTEYHERCFDAAIVDHRRTKASERDIVIAKARSAAGGA